MEKYSRVLIIIFFLCLINLGLSLYTLSKLRQPQPNVSNNQKIEVSPTPRPSPASSSLPIIKTDEVSIKSDLSIIKAEIRAMREVLGVTGSFEELSNLIKTLDQTPKP